MASVSLPAFRSFFLVAIFMTIFIFYYGTQYDAMAPFSLFNPILRQSERPHLFGYLKPNIDARFHNDTSDPIYILTWTKMFGDDWTLWTKTLIKNCDVNPTARCSIISDRSYLNRSAAVLFHPRDIVHTDLPPVKYRFQKYVFHSSESPVLTFAALQGASRTFFDWTMTYRTDSTIYCPYAYFQSLDKESNYDDATMPTEFQTYVNISLAKRPKTALWVVSNCDTHSKRERYVHELRKYIDVDIYGDCGEKCEKNETYDCLYDRIKDYKFYISFENAVCRDYISEKFGYRMALNFVPIVLKREDYDRILRYDIGKNFYQQYGNRSQYYFIAADDFNSPKHLSEYLNYLNTHPNEYLKYFEWRQRYRIIARGGKYCYCDLCSKLYEDRERRRKAFMDTEKSSGQSIENDEDEPFDIHQWWNVDTCDRAMALKLLDPGRKSIF